VKHSKDEKEPRKKRRKKEKQAAASGQDFPTESELLSELSSFDVIEATNATTGDHVEGTVPPWCEVVLKMVRTSDWPVSQTLALRRHDGEWIIEELYKALHPNSGLSITQMLWKEHDGVIDHMMADQLPDGVESKKELRGMARGLGLALAVLTAPYAYDEDAIREMAMERRWIRETLGETTV
jgi:hypothetical protein